MVPLGDPKKATALIGSCEQGGTICEAYLDRHHENWREQTSAASSAASSDAEAPMSRQLALEILGLADGVNEADVIRAHREMMRRLHPDRGGSDYLAKKLNAAKDFLLS